MRRLFGLVMIVTGAAVVCCAVWYSIADVARGESEAFRTLMLAGAVAVAITSLASGFYAHESRTKAMIGLLIALAADLVIGFGSADRMLTTRATIAARSQSVALQIASERQAVADAQAKLDATAKASAAAAATKYCGQGCATDAAATKSLYQRQIDAHQTRLDDLMGGVTVRAGRLGAMIGLSQEASEFMLGAVPLFAFNLLAIYLLKSGMSTLCAPAVSGQRIEKPMPIKSPKTGATLPAVIVENDDVGQFLETALVSRRGSIVRVMTLVERYHDWCLARGLDPVSVDQFSIAIQREVARRGASAEPVKGDVVLHGLAMRSAVMRLVKSA